MAMLLTIIALLGLVAACAPEGDTEAGEPTATPDADVTAEPTAEETATDELPPEVSAAASEAAERGLSFVTSREELEARAAEEESLEVIWALAPDEHIEEYLQSFLDEYPHLQEGGVTVDELSGFEARQRFLLEAEGGSLPDYGVIYAANEVYDETTAYCDWDIYGMAEAGILDIPLEMIDPIKRTVVAASSFPAVFVYNIDAFEDVPLPETWDDLLDPEIYGPDGPISMIADVRVATFAAMASEWGLDRAVEWYGTLAEDIQPTWASRFGSSVQQIQAGEFDAMPFVLLHVAYSGMQGRPDEVQVPSTVGDDLGILFLEPVPVRLTDTHCVANSDINPTPYSSLLFMEWLATDGQAAYENPSSPYQSSLYSDYEGGTGDVLEGLELSVVSWEDLQSFSDWIDQIIEAAGFPQPAED